jgi:hypothetical protein
MKNFLMQILGQTNANRKVKAIEELAIERGNTGGLIKRIDENRESLELLQERVPEFVASHPWLVGWIKANDQFFTQLEGILETHQALRMPQDYPRPWPQRIDDDGKAIGYLFISEPTSSFAGLNPDLNEKIKSFLTQIENEVGTVTEINWWSYRVAPHSCVACDIYGIDNSKTINLNITISGEMAIPEYPGADPLEFKDETDAWCFAALLIERFNLKSVKSISQGFGFSLRANER